MKKIRTILAYYNGEDFVDEQLNSIIKQEIPIGYEHEIFIYNDGSKAESSNYLMKKWSEIDGVKIITQKNSGVFFTFLNAWIESIRDGVNIVFLSDQDDVFLQGRYKEHIKFHEKFGLVTSNSSKWFWELNKFESQRVNGATGHRMSISNDFINLDINKFSRWLEKNKSNKYSTSFHDTFLGRVLPVITTVHFISDVLTKYRVNMKSASRNMSKEQKATLRDAYGFYFDFLKPFFKEVLDKKLTINEFNKSIMIWDKNYLKIKTISWFEKEWNNFWMRLRVRKMRNLLS